MLINNHGRKINYLRLAVTHRCNMRCDCMPVIGNEWLSKEQLLRYEEMLRLYSVLVKMGIVLDEEMVAHVIIKQAIKNSDHTLAYLKCNLVTMKNLE